MDIFEKVFWFAVGFLVARYIVLNTPDYRAKEAEKIDEIRDKVHNLVKKYAPQADDYSIGQDVINTLPD